MAGRLDSEVFSENRNLFRKPNGVMSIRRLHLSSVEIILLPDDAVGPSERDVLI